MPDILALLHCLHPVLHCTRARHLSQLYHARFLAMVYALTGTVLIALWLVEIAWQCILCCG